MRRGVFAWIFQNYCTEINYWIFLYCLLDSFNYWNKINEIANTVGDLPIRSIGAEVLFLAGVNLSRYGWCWLQGMVALVSAILEFAVSEYYGVWIFMKFFSRLNAKKFQSKKKFSRIPREKIKQRGKRKRIICVITYQPPPPVNEQKFAQAKIYYNNKTN